MKAGLEFFRRWLSAEHPRYRRRRAAALGLGLALGYVVLGSPQGLIKLLQGQRAKTKLRADILALQQENQRLQQDLERLRQHPEELELVARQKLNLMKPGEIIYRLPQE